MSSGVRRNDETPDMVPNLAAFGFGGRGTSRLVRVLVSGLSVIVLLLWLVSLALPWYMLEGGASGPNGIALGTATALVAVLFLITFLGVSVRKPVVTTASAIIVVVFLSNLIMMGLTNAPATMSEPCPSDFLVSRYCDYQPPITSPGPGLYLALAASWLALAGGLRDWDGSRRRASGETAVS